MMKKITFISTITLLILTSVSCGKSDPICECFENRLAIKKLHKNTDYKEMKTITESEEYIEMRKKKIECRDVIEPAYFEKNNIKRNGRGDKKFLKDELGDCDAVIELLDNH